VKGGIKVKSKKEKGKNKKVKSKKLKEVVMKVFFVRGQRWQRC